MAGLINLRLLTDFFNKIGPITTFRCVAEFGRYRGNIGLSPAERPEDLWVHGLITFQILVGRTIRCSSCEPKVWPCSFSVELSLSYSDAG